MAVHLKVRTCFDTGHFVRLMFLLCTAPRERERQLTLGYPYTRELLKVEFLLFLQFTFQAIITTDGQTSFTAFIYENPRDRLLRFKQIKVGFFGNRRDFFNVNTRNLERVNVFRIDGKTTI